MDLAFRLRHRVDIQAPATSNVGGVQATAWSTIREGDEPLIPAEIYPLSGREFVAAQAVQAGVTARITVRYRPGLRADMRVVHGDDVYNVLAVLPDPTLRRHLSLMCEKGVNDG